ncbi:tRNA pseudouridine(38/39) synthase [Bienertia sinuspersici]
MLHQSSIARSWFNETDYKFRIKLIVDILQSELFKAFKKTRLLISDRKTSLYSRCGRTDKGVSAAGQVRITHSILNFVTFNLPPPPPPSPPTSTCHPRPQPATTRGMSDVQLRRE